MCAIVWRRSGLSVAVLLFSKRGGSSRPPGQGGWDEGIPIQQAERDQHKNCFAVLLVVVVGK